MNETVLDRYEYMEGFQLFKVPGFQCKRCGNLFFTERQVDDMERRTEELKMHTFAFRRTVAVSGKGLVVRVPSDLAEHLNLKEGEAVRILPVNHDGFLVEREKEGRRSSK
ncbi:MAG: hypothetical protein HY051_04920 [Candidatus Aenigmarchaeota archaeon]|nr:hypothetical protein [Candidatus Aenigmarchaeota archaeon]